MKENVISIKTKFQVFFVAALFAFSAACMYGKGALAASDFTVITKIQGNASARKGVTIELSGSTLGETITKTTANSGLAKFKGLAGGAYTITSTKEGYSYMPEFKEITLAKKKTVTVSFKAVAKVGVDACIGCHNATHPDVYTAWLKGPHGNFNFYDSATQVNSRYEDFLSSGFTYPNDYKKFLGYPDEAWMEEAIKNDSTLAGKTKSYCLNCHGPFSTDNKNIASFPLVNASGKIDTAHATQAERPVVGCESCHGGGTNHVNSPSPATIPYKSPGALQCGQCHNKNFPAGHLEDYPAAASFFGTDVQGGYEFDGKIYAGKNTFGGHSGNRNTCIKCHMREGAAEAPDHHFVPRVADCSASGCHGDINDFKDIRGGSVDYDGDGDMKEGNRGEIETLEKALLAKIQSYASSTIGTGIVYDGATNPYFFVDTDNDGEADVGEITSDNRYNLFDATLLKSAYNYQVSRKEPCGNIHNHRYIIQLLIDSLENLGGDVSGYTRP